MSSCKIWKRQSFRLSESWKCKNAIEYFCSKNGLLHPWLEFILILKVHHSCRTITLTIKCISSNDKKKKTNSTSHKKATGAAARPKISQQLDRPIESYNGLIETFSEEKTRRNLISKAQSYARNLQSQAKSAARQLHKYKESRVKHIFELHSKFSMAVVCFVFLFIGAPMGAIVRKGGFGYPLLIAIIFFMLYS